MSRSSASASGTVYKVDQINNLEYMYIHFNRSISVFGLSCGFSGVFQRQRCGGCISNAFVSGHISDAEAYFGCGAFLGQILKRAFSGHILCEQEHPQKICKHGIFGAHFVRAKTPAKNL